MGKINSIETLDREIRQLQAKAKDLEIRLDESFDYLQDNYSSMIMSSVLRGATGGLKSGVAGTVLGFILSNEKVANTLSNIITGLVDKAASGIDKLAEKMKKKKQEKDE